MAPAATVTLVGTVTPEIAEASAIDKPPVGAALLKVTVAVAVLGPVTDVGLTARVLIVGAETPSVPVTEPPFAVAVIVADWFVPTATVVAVKVAVVAPAATVTVAGTLTVELFEESDTLWPPAGAAALSVTVPVELVPPTTVVGFSETLDTPIGLTVRVPVAELPFAVPLMVAETAEVTAVVFTVKVAFPEPAVKVTVAGTVADVLLELSVAW